MAFRRTLHFDPIDAIRDQWVAHGWEGEARGIAAVTSVIRVGQIFLSRMDEVLRPFGLTMARYEALMLLSFSNHAGSLPMGKVGERLQVHPASVTNTIDRLESAGLVRRIPHPVDGRATLAEITPAGRKVSVQASAAVNDTVFGSLGLSDRDLDSIFSLLRKLRYAAGDFE